MQVQSVPTAHPEITITCDVERSEAASQRQAQFVRLAQSSHLVAGAHLPFPGLGHLRQESAGFGYVPLDYRDRAR